MHSEQELLLKTIWTHPWEDAPRLVYADWLEEQGQTEPAELIRLQCAHAAAAFGSPERDELQPRVERAFEAFRASLASDLPEVLDLDASLFSRGFLEQCWELPASVYLDRAPRWWPRLPVRKLRTRLDPLNVREFLECPELHRLEELALKGMDPHGSVMPLLCRSKHLGGLRVLDLSEYTLGIEAAEALAEAESFTRLESLRLPFNLRPNREAGRLLRRRFGDRAEF